MKPITLTLVVATISLAIVGCGEKHSPEVVRHMERIKSNPMFARMGKEEKKRYLQGLRNTTSMLVQDSQDKDNGLKAIDALLKELE